MKIKNELVSLKIGKKQYDFNNLIMDEYLKRFVKAQLDETKLNRLDYLKELEYCLIKFDMPLKDISSSSVIYNQEFDVFLQHPSKCEQIIKENEITARYNYYSDTVYDFVTKEVVEISKFYGRKITALGFNTWFSESSNLPVLAILDVSKYNIYLEENQELSITRQDKITTDAIFYSNNKEKVPGPAHLAPSGLPQIIYQPKIYNDDGTSYASYYNNAFGILYSIGFSTYTNYIDNEFVVEKDVEVEINGTELIIKGLRNYLSKDNSLFPLKDINPVSDLYPIKETYKYMILKYKVWQEVYTGTYQNVTSTITDTGYYYYQAIPVETFGKANLKIKYERG